MTAMTTMTAADVHAGDVVLLHTLRDTTTRQRVSDVTRHALTITYPVTRTQEVFDVVRLHFGGMTLDYAPDSTVTIAALG